MRLQGKGQSRSRGVWVGLALVVGFALPTLFNLLIPPTAYVDDMPGGPYRYSGLFDPPDNSFGFFDPETAADGTTYRWTTSHATITFPYAANAGRHAIISLRMGGAWAPGQPPAEVTLSLNGRPYSRFSVSGPFAVYTATLDTARIPNPYLDPAHVQVDILSSTFSTSQDPRELGVAVDSVRVQPERSRAEIVAEGLVWALSLGLLGIVAFARLAQRWALAFLVAALLSFAAIHLSYVPRSIGVGVEVALAGLGWLLAVLLAPRRRPVWGLGLGACLVWVVVAGRLGEWQIDDAYITYRYAWNLVNGHSLVYNPGEAPVEGYTAFLWALVAAGAMWAGLHLAGVIQAINVAAGLGLIATAFYLGGRLARGSFAWPLVVAALLAVDVSLLVYSARGSGMETILFACLVLVAVTLLWEPPGRLGARAGIAAGIALGLASLTRPEGLLVAALLLGAKMWQNRAIGTKSWGLLLPTILPFLAIVLPYQVWRIGFYGYPFPNTFYAKTGLSPALVGRGASYAWDFALSHWLIIALLVIGASLALFARFSGPRKRAALPDTRANLVRALAVLVVGYTLYIIAAGGDHFVGWRFFVPLLAPLALLAQEALKEIGQRLPALGPARWSAAATLSVALLAYAGYSLWLQGDDGPVGQRTRRETTALERWGSAALWLRENTPPQTLTAAFTAGAMAYYSRRPVVDMLGLNDLYIGRLSVAGLGEGVAGHEKRDPAYVLSRKPDYILATWEDYFKPYADRVKQEFRYETVRSPTGALVKWLRRNDAAGP